jgi:transcriptional regulator with XRE-family HTH domain
LNFAAMPTGGTEQQLYRIIGLRIRERRDALELTQAQLAQLVGLSRTSITNIESGRQPAPLHQFVRIATALDIDVHALLPDRAELHRQAAVEVLFDGAQQRTPPKAASLIAQVLNASEGAEQ